MTGNNKHFGTAGPDLIHFSSGIINTLFIVAGYQGPAAAATADLIHASGIQIQPVFHTLIQNPARFLKKTISEAPLGFTTVIAGIMIGGRPIESGSIQFNAARFNVLDEQIKNRYKSEFLKNLRIMIFETRPGCQIGMPSFRP